jgi:nitronate monooxygenase
MNIEVASNFLAETIPGEAVRESPQEAKRWRDIWSAGQGVPLIDKVDSIAGIVDSIVREYHDTVARLVG